ncbi:tetratricopeptide repeat protein [Parvularcula marina]|uniref:tetratricopeptide repeat protein n=1 Tax=Parvularcula marina TaxID=2292771 RepID=UPI003517F100
MTRLPCLIAALFGVLCLSTAGATPDKETASGENPRVAMLRYEAAIKDDPDDLDARFGLAEALLQLGEYDRAEKMAEIVMRRASDKEARLVFAEALLRQGRIDDAAKALDVSYELSSDGAALKSVIDAEQALSVGNYEAALRAIEPTTGHPRYAPMARVVAARAFYAVGNLSMAKRLIDDIIADGGDSLTALLFRARLALRAGDPGTAMRLADGIDALDKGNISAGSIVIEALLREGRIDEARARLNRLKAVSLDDPRPAYLEGIILAAEGKTRDAALRVSGIEEWLTYNSGGAIFLAGLKSELGFSSQAEAILRQRLTAEPGDLEVIRELTGLLDRDGRADEADEVMKRSLSIMPGHPVLVQLEADRLAARGDFDASVALLSTLPEGTAQTGLWDVLGQQNDDVTAARMFASIRAGDPQSAIEMAEAAGTDDIMVQNMLAAALAETGEIESAKSVLDRLITKEPDFLAAIVNRAGLEQGPTALVDTLTLAENAGATSARIHRQLAIESFVVGDTAKALDAAGKAAAAEDSVASDKLLTARIHLAMGQGEEAAASLMAIPARENEPVSEQVYRLWLLSLAGEEEMASEAAAKIALPQTEQLAGLQLADIFDRADDKEREAGILATLRRSAPDNLSLTERYLMALAAEDLSAAQRALASTPGLSQELREALGARLLIEAGRATDARTALEKMTPSAAVFAAELSIAETPAEKRDLLDRMARYSAATPGDAGVLVLLSGLAIELGDLPRAENALSGALAAMPGNPGVLNNLALARQKKSLVEALRLAEEAYQAAPEEPAFAETYASLLVESRDQARAGRVARRALLADPRAESLVPFRDLGLRG